MFVPVTKKKKKNCSRLEKASEATWGTHIWPQLCFGVCAHRQVCLSFWQGSTVGFQTSLHAVIINVHIWLDLVLESYKGPNGLF